MRKHPVIMPALIIGVICVSFVCANRTQRQNHSKHQRLASDNKAVSFVKLDPSRDIVYVTSIFSNQESSTITGVCNELKSRGFKFGIPPKATLRENPWMSGGYPQKSSHSANFVVICALKLIASEGKEFPFVEPVYDRIVGTRLERVNVE